MKRFENFVLAVEIAFLLAVVGGAGPWGPASWAAPAAPSPLATGSFAFTAAGDFGFGDDTRDVMAGMGDSGDFAIALGDFSYHETSVANWCGYFEGQVGDGRAILIVGNHDTDEINTFREHCNFGLDASMSGDYAKEFYFDYPRSSPLARFILTSAGTMGGDHYGFVSGAIDGARDAGIPYVIVGMHKNCITTGVKGCEIGEGFQDLLFSKRVDLILQGHDHNYQRSHQLTCADDNNFRSECVADTDDDHRRGEGAVLNIVGTGGRGTYSTGDGPEVAYFKTWSSDTRGFLRVEVSADAMNVAYRGVRGTYGDGYVISGSGSPPPPPPPDPPPPPPDNPPPPPPDNRIATEVTMLPEVPDPSSPGEIVTMGATLVRADTRAPLSGKYIRIQGTDNGGSSWWEAGLYLTDATGHTTGGVVFNAGDNQGLRAMFEGDDTYAASVSAVEPHATHQSLAPPPGPPPMIPTRVVIEPESPDPSAPGDVVALSAVLTVASTGVPIPNQFIHMEGRDFEGQTWWHAGYYWTDANGRAVGGTRFLFAHETQRLRATFDGDPVFAPSVSALEPHATRGPALAPSVGSSGGAGDPLPQDASIAAVAALMAPTVALRVFRRRRDRSP